MSLSTEMQRRKKNKNESVLLQLCHLFLINMNICF